ncbi:MAG: ferrous iron transport protein B [Candidatus Omnitrophota bacterium]
MSDPILSSVKASSKQIPLIVALAGNPNSGKTTVFNALTNLRQKVGNYPGVTVEKKIGRMVTGHQREINILDLPGTYSLAVRSPDEKVARDVLLGKIVDTPKPDVVVCVVDASNLERNLYLVSQIQDLGIPMVIALNMVDTAKRRGQEIDAVKLSAVLGIPVIPTVASRNEGIEELKKAIISGGGKMPKDRPWKMPPVMEAEVKEFTEFLFHETFADAKTVFSQAIIFISAEDHTLPENKVVVDYIKNLRQKLQTQNINWRSAAVEARYAWIQNIVRSVTKESDQSVLTVTDKLDNILTHRIWGWVIFLGLMVLMFFTIFSVASYPMDWIDQVFSALTDTVKTMMPPGDLRDLLTDGVIAGVGAVVIFLPQILILFFFIGLLQDTGYMARAAFIMDRVMSKVGLHGKSFIPLLSSFACAIPGIMSARTIENPKDRLVTILVAPLMSCSARLPVYTVMIATLMPSASAPQKAGIILIMYLLGMLGAFVMAWIFKKTLLKSQTPLLIMELPPYRLPSWKTVLINMWERSLVFLKRAGTIIFGLSILLWALMTYPKHDGLTASEGLRKSFAGMTGEALEPIIKPLGYDWRIGIGLVGSFAAREVFVSTMSIVFNIDEAADETDSVREAFVKARWPDGSVLFTPLVCIGLMVFYVFAMQCMSTIAVVRRETNSWFWPCFQVFYMTGLAYVLALAVFQGGRLLGWQ